MTDDKIIEIKKKLNKLFRRSASDLLKSFYVEKKGNYNVYFVPINSIINNGQSILAVDNSELCEIIDLLDSDKK